MPSKLKYLMVAALAAASLLCSSSGHAGQYMQFLHVKNLQVVNGDWLPLTNATPPVPVKSTFSVGSATLKFAPSTLNFGYVRAGAQSKAQVVTLANLGTKAMRLGTLSSNDQFLVTGDCDGVYLPVLGTCQVRVAFAPTEIATAGITGTLLVPATTGFARSRGALTLEGAAIPADTAHNQAAVLEGFAMADSSLTRNSSGRALITYPDAYAMGDTLSRSFLMRSTGTADLSIRSAKFSGNDGTFGGTTNCSGMLAPGKACEVTVNFSPVTVGTKVATLNIKTGSVLGTNMPVTVRGRSLAANSFETSTKRLRFGATSVNSTITRTFVVSNTGNVPLLSGSVERTGDAFLVDHNCPETLPVGASCFVTVDFSPPVAGDFNETVYVAYAQVPRASVALTGRANGGWVRATPEVQRFADVAPGETASLTYQLSNEGNLGTPLTYTALPLGVTRTGTCAAVLSTGSSCQLVLTYAPSADKPLAGVLTISGSYNATTLGFISSNR